MSPGADNLHTLSIREFFCGMTFFLLPPLGFFAYGLSGDLGGAVIMIGGPVFLAAVVLSPIGVIVAENVSPNHSNFTRAAIFFVSGLVYVFGWRVIVELSNMPVLPIIYAIFGPIAIPAIVSMPKTLL